MNPRFKAGPSVSILIALMTSNLAFATSKPDLAKWQSATTRVISPTANRHTIHAYFNACPESPDGKYVLLYTSPEENGEKGDLRVVERATGLERIIATSITTEDAHRAACQHWVNGGKHVVFHDFRNGRWVVASVEVSTGRERVLAEDRQTGFGAPSSPWAAVYGCHWNPGEYRDLQLIHVETGEVKTPVTMAQTLKQYADWANKKFQSNDLSIFFPILSPDGKRVFFKLSRPSGGSDFRSPTASLREGKFIFDLEEGCFIGMRENWGHPSWHPESGHIFEKGKKLYSLETRKTTYFAPSAPSDHPSVSPDGTQFVTDANVATQPFGKPGDWAVIVGSMQEDEFVVVDQFNNTHGATSWRRNHPHPTFSADGRRVYYNVNSGPWTTLKVAEAAP